MTNSFEKASKRMFKYQVLRKSFEPFFIERLELVYQIRTSINISEINDYPERHLKGNYYILFEENHSSRFFENLTSEI